MSVPAAEAFCVLFTTALICIAFVLVSYSRNKTPVKETTIMSSWLTQDAATIRAFLRHIDYKDLLPEAKAAFEGLIVSGVKEFLAKNNTPTELQVQLWADTQIANWINIGCTAVPMPYMPIIKSIMVHYAETETNRLVSAAYAAATAEVASAQAKYIKEEPTTLQALENKIVEAVEKL
jgi:hypothetical protein